MTTSTSGMNAIVAVTIALLLPSGLSTNGWCHVTKFYCRNRLWETLTTTKCESCVMHLNPNFGSVHHNVSSLSPEKGPKSQLKNSRCWGWCVAWWLAYPNLLQDMTTVSLLIWEKKMERESWVHWIHWIRKHEGRKGGMERVGEEEEEDEEEDAMRWDESVIRKSMRAKQKNKNK